MVNLSSICLLSLFAFVSADIAVKDKAIASHLRPRLFGKPSQAGTSNNATFGLTTRDLTVRDLNDISARQLTCNPGYGYCDGTSPPLFSFLDSPTFN